MQNSGAAAFLARLIYLAHALQSQTALGYSEPCAGQHDEVSFVQQRMNYSTNLGPDLDLEEDASAEHAPQFRLEDAEALFNLGMGAVHDSSTGPTLEEKGIALLQSLAQHHSVAGTGTQETLKQAALSLKNDLDERLWAESRTKVTPEWVEITLGSDNKKPGICWNFFGGKPLQCEVEPQMMPQDKGDYANPCERLCADYDWCSGYGYGKRPKEVPAPVDNSNPSPVQQQANLNPVQQQQQMITVEEDVCLLMNNGAEPCPNSWVTYGLVATISARDLKVYPVEADVGEPGSNFPYKCTAKYSDPTSRAILPSRFLFDQKAPVTDPKTNVKIQKEAKCFHKDGQHLHECKVKLDDLFEVDKKGWKLKGTDDEIDWPNRCEKICAGLDWCVAYSYFPGNKHSMYLNDPECDLHSNLDEGCPTGKSWVRTPDPQNERLAAASSDDVEADPAGRGWQRYGQMCRAKSVSWKGKFQQMFQPGPDTILCKVSKGVMIAQSVMAVASLMGNLECSRQNTLNSKTRLADPNLLDKHTVKNISRGFKHWSLSKAGRTALTQILSHDEGTELSGLRLSKGFDKAKCYLQTSSAGMRWSLGSFANYYEKQYQCKEGADPDLKAQMFCRSSLLRTVGRGLFGAGLYGFTAIKQNCGTETVQLTKFFCGLDYGKIVLYVGKMVFHVLQLAFFLNADQAWEKASTAMNVGAAMIFLGEAIVRTMGPCLGLMKGNEDATIIKDGTCIGTYLEEFALGVYTTSSAVQSYNYCMKK